MELNEYQVAIRETAIYPEAGEGTFGAIAYCGLGLGEAGEVQGKIKKIWRDTHGSITQEALDAIEAELGDVMWYFARLCDELNLIPEEILDKNLAKLLDRKARGVIGGSGDNR